MPPIHPPQSAKNSSLTVQVWRDDSVSFEGLLRRVPSSSPLLCLGSSRSEFSFLALAWEEVDWQDLGQMPLEPKASLTATSAATGLGYVLLHSYDSCAARPGAPSRAFRVRKSLVRHEASGQQWLCEAEGAEACPYKVPWPLPTQPGDQSSEPARWSLAEGELDDTGYLQKVRDVIEDIRRGRFYQLNLLRYWHSEATLARHYWLERLEAAGGPFSAFIDLPDLGLVSCSPERFVRISWDGRGGLIRTEPIKGTRPVRADFAADLAEKEDLARHPKDRAELSMIVDLMRNDLQKISVPGSVQVLDPGTVHSFTQVHHLIACIESRLRASLVWGDIWQALCPGGSITGAPKREVMQAIFEKEQRNRGYLMGHLIFIDSYSGCWDSSILIRTAQRRVDGRWEYAAGSGLTIHSEPAAELAEVAAKARVILG